MPIRHRGEVVGVLYLENRRAHTTLAPSQLDTLQLIGQQFAVAFENAPMNRSLELQVRARTDELQRENLERRRAEEAAEAANRAKREFLVESSARSLLDIIDDISKIEAGKLEIEQVSFDLDEVMLGLRDVVGARADERGLAFRIVEAPGLPLKLVGDPMRPGQVLLNLGNNAVKFTEQGAVTISADVVERGAADVLLRFKVRDTGIGMNDHIAKPIVIDAMFETIARWVRATAAPVSATVASAALSLESLVGIDLAAGRARTMNNDKLYRRLLSALGPALRDFSSRFRGARDSSEPSQAERLVHDLTSNCGSVGARGVAQAARALESEIRGRADAAELQGLLAAVDHEIAVVLPGLERLSV